MIDIASSAPVSPLPTLAAPTLPPPATAEAPAPRRRRALPIALGALALLGTAGTVAGFAGKASSDSRNSDLARDNGNLVADLDDADAQVLDLERRLGEAQSEITQLEGDLADSSAERLTLQRDLATARAELSAAQAQTDLSSIDAVPSLNDGVVSPGEAQLIAEQIETYGFDAGAIDPVRYQEIADRACAADSLAGLDGVVGWLRAGTPQISVDAATFVVASAGSAACQSHVYDVLGV